jgi:Fe-S-cluster-containing dehydrogenase component
MAECPPVGFQWVREAKAGGAKVIHIVPRFTRCLMSWDACRHCRHAGCPDVCPTGALFRSEFRHRGHPRRGAGRHP